MELHFFHQPIVSIPLNFGVVANQPNCCFHIVLSSKQWRQFINCTVYDVRVAITYARNIITLASFNLEQISC